MMYEIREMLGSILYEGVVMVGYHGSSHYIEEFSDEYVGRGNDQEGPGIYFTTDRDEAIGYAQGVGGYVYDVRLRIGKMLGLGGRMSKKEFEYMLGGVKDLEYSLLNWGSEDREENIKMLKDSIYSGEGKRGMFLNIWYELYRDSPLEYVRRVVKLGYDGFIVDRVGVRHIVVYNPGVIEIQKREEV